LLCDEKGKLGEEAMGEEHAKTGKIAYCLL
jgi:hypothetical protein